jgi:hypothetical protein
MNRLFIGALAAALWTPTTSPSNIDLGSSTVPVGPPWISIEYPVNPYDRTTRDAYLVVHAFHHGTPVDFPVSGSAEGIVNGQRRTVSLEFTRTSRPGAYALSKQWPNDGTWTLVISVAQGPEDKVFAVVDIARGGQVASVRVPTRRSGGDQIPIPAPVAMSEIEASLKNRAAQLANGR